MKLSLAFFVLVLFSLSACEAAPTPVAVAVQPTEDPSDLATQPPPLRIGIAPDTIGYVDNLAEMRNVALVNAISEADDLESYDLLIVFGTRDNWEQSPIQHRVSLLINPQLPPLDQPDVAMLLRQSINVQALNNATGIIGLQPQIVETLPPTALRTALANAGYPDGLSLSIAHTEFHALAEVQNQLLALNFDTRLLPTPLADMETRFVEQQAHLALVHWWDAEQRSTWVQLLGEDNVLDLYTLPISYRAVDTLQVNFSPSGWPVPQAASGL